MEVVRRGRSRRLTSPEVTTRLLLQPLEWRERAVEELALDSASFVRRRRTLQVLPLRPLLQDLLPAACSATTARLVLPVATLDKRPLPDVDVTSPHGDAVLIRRFEIAPRQI